MQQGELDLAYKGKVDTAQKAVRFDADKLRYDLNAPEVAMAYATIMTMGAKKYSDRNWEKGMDWGRCLASAERHKQLWLMGEEIDQESGYPHTWHWLWNVATLVVYEMRKVGTDNIRRKPLRPEWVDLPPDVIAVAQTLDGRI